MRLYILFSLGISLICVLVHARLRFGFVKNVPMALPIIIRGEFGVPFRGQLSGKQSARPRQEATRLSDQCLRPFGVIRDLGLAARQAAARSSMLDVQQLPRVRLQHLRTVVPVSSDRPDHEVDYVVRLELNPPLPEPFSYRVAWAKCDMLATVGFERLDLFHTARDQYGKRRYLHPKLTGADLERVKSGVLHAPCDSVT
jgi:mRNA interferase MazF